jgi:hypothetical protein
MFSMSNYVKSEKSKGVLAFANNTPTTDYESIGARTLELAGQSLGLPTKLITGQQQADWHNMRRDVDTLQPVAWNNHSRWQCYELTPWDQTLVIDIDLLVMTDRLLRLFDHLQDYQLCHHNTTLFTQDAVSFAPVWATVFAFEKTPAAKDFFELVGRIQRNWNYYRMLFGIVQIEFRNDYAFAMAEIILGGHTRTQQSRMPWGITTVDAPVDNIEWVNDWLVVRTADTARVLPRCDLHVMSKAWLQTPALDVLIQGVPV